MKYQQRPFNIYEYLKELSRLSKGASKTDEEMKKICQEFECSVDSSKEEEEKEKLRQVFIKCDESAKADQARQKRKYKKKQPESLIF